MQWYGSAQRALPWRTPGCSPWGVLVSEVMLQQTPVVRVLPVWPTWLERWPDPASLAAEPPGEAVAAWGRLGYPRRALRLHAAATTCVERSGARCRTPTTICVRCRGSVTTPQQQWRRSPSVGARWSSTPTSAACSRGSSAAIAFEPPGAPTADERARAADAASRGTRGVGRVERRRSWSSAPWCARHGRPRCVRCPVGRTLRLAARRVTRVGRATSARSDVRGNRPPGSRAGSSPCCGRPPTRCRRARWTRSGETRAARPRPRQPGRRRPGRARRRRRLPAPRRDRLTHLLRRQRRARAAVRAAPGPIRSRRRPRRPDRSDRPRGGPAPAARCPRRRTPPARP